MGELPAWDQRKVRREVLKDTIQHPVTLFFSAGAIISGLYTGLLNPTPEGFLASLLSVGIATGSWIFNYFFRTDHFVQRYHQKWLKERESRQKEALQEIREKFEKLRYKEGLQAFDDLQSAYSRFTAFLHSDDAAGLTSLQRSRIQNVGQETFELGMDTVKRLAVLADIAANVDIGRYLKEVDELEYTIRKLKRKKTLDQQETLTLENLQKRQLAIKSRITSFKQVHTEMEALLAKAEECENAIENSMLQLPVSSGTVEDQQLQRALSEMQLTIEAARRTSARMQDLDVNRDRDHLPGDSLYVNPE